MTIAELLKEAERESAMRRKVYPNSAGSPESKKRQLRAMDDIERVLSYCASQPEILAALAERKVIDQIQNELF